MESRRHSMTTERGYRPCPLKQGLRAKRVATDIRARLTDLLARDVSDTLLGRAVVITGVDLPDDLTALRGVNARFAHRRRRSGAQTQGGGGPSSVPVRAFDMGSAAP